LRFSGCFPFLSSMDIHDIQRLSFLNLFLSFGPLVHLRWPMGPLQLSFAPTGSNLYLRHWLTPAHLTTPPLSKGHKSRTRGSRPTLTLANRRRYIVGSSSGNPCPSRTCWRIRRTRNRRRERTRAPLRRCTGGRFRRLRDKKPCDGTGLHGYRRLKQAKRELLKNRVVAARQCS